MNLDQPYAQRGSSSRYFKRSDFVVVSQSPRHLLVHAQNEDLDFWLLSAHAPHGGTALHPTDRTSSGSTSLVSTVLPKKICKIMTFNISLGTANVRTFYRGDEGHPGKLQYVREQFQAHGLHFLGLQETRCAQGTSFQNHIYRIVSGHQGGHLGVDMIG